MRQFKSAHGIIIIIIEGTGRMELYLFFKVITESIPVMELILQANKIREKNKAGIQIWWGYRGDPPPYSLRCVVQLTISR